MWFPLLPLAAPAETAKRFCLVALSTTAAGSAALYAFGVRGGGATTGEFRSIPPLHMWLRWDAGWYQGIATDGYYFSSSEQSSVAFFPLYPILIRALSFLGINPFIAGICLTFCFGLLAACLFRTWANQVSKEANWATWALLLWPFAFYLYGAMYSDALFLCLVIAAFLSLERDSLGWAVLWGALATACRPMAPAVVLGLLSRRLELRRNAGQAWRFRDFLPVLSSAGLAFYVAYLAIRFGEPLAFVKTQVGWRQLSGVGSVLKVDLWHQLQKSSSPVGVAIFAAFHAALAFLFLALVPRIWSEIGKGYALYVAIVVGIPLLTSRDLTGVGRYCLAAFPAFAALASTLAAQPRRKIAWLIASAGSLILMTVKFAIGQYVA